MSPADLRVLRAICAAAPDDINMGLTLYPVRLLRVLLAAYEAQQACECQGPDGLAGRGA